MAVTTFESLSDRSDTCTCGSENLMLHKEIGYDVWPGGHENQHVEICNDCQNWRWVFTRWKSDVVSPKYVVADWEEENKPFTIY